MYVLQSKIKISQHSFRMHAINFNCFMINIVYILFVAFIFYVFFFFVILENEANKNILVSLHVFYNGICKRKDPHENSISIDPHTEHLYNKFIFKK